MVGGSWWAQDITNAINTSLLKKASLPDNETNSYWPSRQQHWRRRVNHIKKKRNIKWLLDNYESFIIFFFFTRSFFLYHSYTQSWCSASTSSTEGANFDFSSIYQQLIYHIWFIILNRFLELVIFGWGQEP